MVVLGACYPGQGAQKEGMALDLYAKSKQVRSLFDLASDITSLDMLSLMKKGSQVTEEAQLAITLANRSSTLVLQQMGITPSCHCGFSLGELSAYAASGVLDDEQLFTLVQERSTLMGQATEIVRQQIGPLGMAAVVGLGFAQVKQMIEKEGLEHLYCANDNSPFQLTISGALSSIEQASSLLKALGAKRVIPLRVSGPFHTPFMLTVEKQFAKIVHQMDFKEPHTPVYLNVSGLVAQSVEQIIQGCIDQLSQPVRWTQIMQALISEQKVAAALEIGPGKVLGGLWNSLSSGIPCHSCESWETIEATVRELR